MAVVRQAAAAAGGGDSSGLVAVLVGVAAALVLNEWLLRGARDRAPPGPAKTAVTAVTTPDTDTARRSSSATAAARADLPASRATATAAAAAPATWIDPAAPLGLVLNEGLDRFHPADAHANTLVEENRRSLGAVVAVARRAAVRMPLCSPDSDGASGGDSDSDSGADSDSDSDSDSAGSADAGDDGHVRNIVSLATLQPLTQSPNVHLKRRAVDILLDRAMGTATLAPMLDACDGVDPTLRLHALATLHQLSQIPDHREALIDCGVLPRLVRVLYLPNETPSVYRYAVTALYRLVGHDLPYKAAIVRHGVLKPVLAFLRAENPLLDTTASPLNPFIPPVGTASRSADRPGSRRVTRDMDHEVETDHHSESTHTVTVDVDDDVDDRFGPALSPAHHVYHGDLKYWALLLLRNLVVHEEFHAALLEQGVMRLLARITRLTFGNVAMQKLCFHALVRLVSGMENAAAAAALERLLDIRMVSLIAACLRSEDTELVSWAIFLMHEFIIKDIAREAFTQIRGLVRILTGVMGSTETAIPRIVLRTLKCLGIRNEGFQADMVRQGVLGPLIPALSSSDDETRFWALALLHDLLVHADAQDAFLALDGLARLVEASRVASHHQGLYIADILVYLCGRRANHPQILQSSILRAIHTFCESDDAGLSYAGTAILLNLATIDPAMVHKMREAGLLWTLRRMVLVSDRAAVQTVAAKTIVTIARHAPSLTEFLYDGTVVPLLERIVALMPTLLDGLAAAPRSVAEIAAVNMLTLAQSAATVVNLLGVLEIILQPRVFAHQTWNKADDEIAHLTDVHHQMFVAIDHCLTLLAMQAHRDATHRRVDDDADNRSSWPLHHDVDSDGHVEGHASPVMAATPAVWSQSWPERAARRVDSTADVADIAHPADCDADADAAIRDFLSQQRTILMAVADKALPLLPPLFNGCPFAVFPGGTPVLGNLLRVAMVTSLQPTHVPDTALLALARCLTPLTTPYLVQACPLVTWDLVFRGATDHVAMMPLTGWNGGQTGAAPTMPFLDDPQRAMMLLMQSASRRPPPRASHQAPSPSSSASPVAPSSPSVPETAPQRPTFYQTAVLEAVTLWGLPSAQGPALLSLPVMRPDDATPYLEFTPGRSRLCNPSWTFESARASHGLDRSHSHAQVAYEVKLASDGIIQIGWCTAACRFDPETGTGVGDDAHSYAYDGQRCRRWHDGVAVDNSYGAPWSVGDRITAILDLHAGTLAYLHNGLPLGIAYTGVDTRQTWYPAVSLAKAQDCVVAFGSGLDPLIYCPENVQPFAVAFAPSPPPPAVPASPAGPIPHAASTITGLASHLHSPVTASTLSQPVHLALGDPPAPPRIIQLRPAKRGRRGPAVGAPTRPAGPSLLSASEPGVVGAGAVAAASTTSPVAPTAATPSASSGQRRAKPNGAVSSPTKAERTREIRPRSRPEPTSPRTASPTLGAVAALRYEQLLSDALADTASDDESVRSPGMPTPNTWRHELLTEAHGNGDGRTNARAMGSLPSRLATGSRSPLSDDAPPMPVPAAATAAVSTTRSSRGRMTPRSCSSLLARDVDRVVSADESDPVDAAVNGVFALTASLEKAVAEGTHALLSGGLNGGCHDGEDGEGREDGEDSEDGPHIVNALDHHDACASMSTTAHGTAAATATAAADASTGVGLGVGANGILLSGAASRRHSVMEYITAPASPFPMSAMTDRDAGPPSALPVESLIVHGGRHAIDIDVHLLLPSYHEAVSFVGWVSVGRADGGPVGLHGLAISTTTEEMWYLTYEVPPPRSWSRENAAGSGTGAAPSHVASTPLEALYALSGALEAIRHEHLIGKARFPGLHVLRRFSRIPVWLRQMQAIHLTMFCDDVTPKPVGTVRNMTADSSSFSSSLVDSVPLVPSPAASAPHDLFASTSTLARTDAAPLPTLPPTLVAAPPRPPPLVTVPGDLVASRQASPPSAFCSRSGDGSTPTEFTSPGILQSPFSVAAELATLVSVRLPSSDPPSSAPSATKPAGHFDAMAWDHDSSEMPPAGVPVTDSTGTNTSTDASIEALRPSVTTGHAPPAAALPALLPASSPPISCAPPQWRMTCQVSGPDGPLYAPVTLPSASPWIPCVHNMTHAALMPAYPEC